ncbi:exo-alpha-sialidase [Planctomycetes bacterium Pan216]
MLTAVTVARGEEATWKLQPLKYNDPDLVVDLGVGLWAFPLPMDYDDDGDLDLLVSCPDKPSNGTYYFENPSQDPKEKMPVFKPGVRLGPGHHFMLLSEVAGEPVVLRPGQEYRRDPKTKTFDFGQSTRIAAPSNPHAPTGRNIRANMWRYVDFDGDGDRDIIVGIGDWSDYSWDHAYDRQGRWKNGPLHGYVYLIANEGSDAEPRYAKTARRLSAAGRDIDVYGWPCPNMADFDGDGDLDLLCGEFLDGFTYFQNIGTRERPEFAAGERLDNDRGEPLVMHLQMITPTAIDWDRDGDLDLVVGDEDGRVALIENTGKLRDRLPVFRSPAYFQQQADTLKFGALATPFAYDWDGDGDEDILCGNTAGSIALFENKGDAANGLPRWAAPKRLRVVNGGGESEPFRVMAGPSGSIQGPCEAKWGYTTLSVADWDGDGDGDILYNSILAKLGLLRNDAGKLNDETFDSGREEMPPRWYWWQSPSSGALTQWRTTPLGVDFDGDKSLDLVMLDQEGYLTLRSRGGEAKRVFVDEDFEPLQLNSGRCGRSGRVKLAVVDWDRDGRLDILVNSQNATWYRNVASRDGKTVLKRVGNLAKRNVAGHTSSPAVCDFDKDGRPDLLVGSENGRIYHIAHDDCETFSPEAIALRQPATPATPLFPGVIKEEFIFNKAPFPQCHASTICDSSRGLIASWFGGKKEGAKDVGIWVSYHDGARWSSPREVANGIQHTSLRYPCWNPVLYQPPGDAATLLFFKVGPDPRKWWGELMVSHDRGRTFGERRRLPESIDGPVRCKPILLADGKTLLSGSSTEYDGWRVHFEAIELDDQQPSGPWSRIGPINDASKYNAIQPTLIHHKDGRLQALCRTKEGIVVTSFSSDGGKTWSPLEATSLPNPNSGIDAVTLDDGRFLLVYNPIGSPKSGWGRRDRLRLAQSHDGMNWETVGDFEQERGGEFSYPAIIQSADGKVHVTYTWKRRKIKHVEIDPEHLAVVKPDGDDR